MEPFTLFLIIISLFVIIGIVYFYYNRTHWKKYFAILGTVGVVGGAILITPITYIPLKGNYTTTTETHCVDGTCWKALYSGIRFIPVEGVFGKGYVKIEDYKHSLKEYFNVKYLDYDSGLDIKVKDFGYDWIEFDFSVKDEKYLSQMLPVKVDNQQVKTFLWNEKDDIRSYRIEGKNILSSNYTFGKNSTTIMLQDADSENLEDNYLEENNPDDNNGDSTVLVSGATAGVEPVRSRSSLIKFNITSVLGYSIDDSSLNFFIYSNGYDTGETAITYIWEVSNQTWDEGSGTWANKPSTGALIDTIDGIDGDADDFWISFNATEWVANEVGLSKNNVSFYWNASLEDLGDALVTRSKEYATTSLTPYLNITYSEAGDITPPTYSDNSTNSTIAGTSIEHRLKWEDSRLSGYIFSFDNCTETFNNNTWTPISGIENWSNVTKTINDTVGCTVQWCVYANDTSDNWNGTSCSIPFSYLTTIAGDTCTCSSIQGETPIDCSENCIIDTCDVAGVDITFTGAGTITVAGDVTNIGDTTFSVGCAVELCPGCQWG